MLPRCKTMAEMRSPEFMQKMAEGPVWIITVRPNGVAGMGKPLVLWFVYIAAGRAVRGLHRRAFAGAQARTTSPCSASSAPRRSWPSHSGLLHDSIWYARQWSTTIKLMFDGLIYALVLGGTFGWLWPKAVDVTALAIRVRRVCVRWRRRSAPAASTAPGLRRVRGAQCPRPRCQRPRAGSPPSAVHRDRTPRPK